MPTPVTSVRAINETTYPAGSKIHGFEVSRTKCITAELYSRGPADWLTVVCRGFIGNVRQTLSQCLKIRHTCFTRLNLLYTNYPTVIHYVCNLS